MYLNDVAIKALIGVKPTYMRPPYLSVNPQVLTALGSWGYTVVGVNLDTMDWQHNNLANEVELNQASYDAAMKTGAISYISLDHDFTTMIVPWLTKMIDQTLAKGFRFVSVVDCLGSGAAYRA